MSRPNNSLNPIFVTNSSILNVKINANFSQCLCEAPEILYALKCRHHICYLDHINGDLKWRKCPFCDEHFSMSSPNFFSHIRQHGNCYDDKAKYWVCSECPSRFKRIRLCTYLSHIYTAHQMGTPYHCPKCEFTTGSFELCQRHATVHDESSHPCPNCSYIAQSRFRLTKHIYNMHTNIECRKNG